MDKISGYFNDCFSDNYFIFNLTHKTNANTDEESKYLVTTTTILLDQIVQEDTVVEEEDKRDGHSQVLSKIVQPKTEFITQYITNFNFALQPGRKSKGVYMYALVDIGNQIYTERSFEDFVILRKVLNDIYPTCFLPILPDKEYFKMKGSDCFEDRRFHALKEFWDQVFGQTHLASTDAFQEFIDPSCNASKIRYSKSSLNQMLNRYKTSFQNLRGASLDESLYARIDDFDDLIKEAQKKIKDLQEQIKAYQKLELVSANEEEMVYKVLKSVEKIILRGNYKESKDAMNSNLIKQLCELPKKVHCK
jgi:hypothetical protein